MIWWCLKFVFVAFRISASGNCGDCIWQVLNSDKQKLASGMKGQQMYTKNELESHAYVWGWSSVIGNDNGSYHKIHVHNTIGLKQSIGCSYYHAEIGLILWQMLPCYIILIVSPHSRSHRAHAEKGSRRRKNMYCVIDNTDTYTWSTS